MSKIEQDFKLNKLSSDARDRQKVIPMQISNSFQIYILFQAEILTALRQLGEQLTVEDLQFLEKHNNIANAFKNIEFIEVEDQ